MSEQLAFPWTSTLTTRELLIQLPERGPWSATEHEREVLEFKETPGSTPAPAHVRKQADERLRTDLVETAISFANARGGTLVVGVKDRAVEGEIVVPGVDLDDWSPDDLRQIIYERTAPHLLVTVTVETVHERPILLVSVTIGPEIYGTTKGVFKHRKLDRNLPLDEPTMRALRAARGRYDWTAEPVPAGTASISRAALAKAAERLRRRGVEELAKAAETDPRQYLSDTGLLDGDGRLRRAALLLYGTDQALREHIPTWGVLLRTSPSPGSEGTILVRKDDGGGGLLFVLDSLLERLSLLVRAETIRAGSEQIELIDYPPDALRELIANAFAHRDWEADGIVEIVHSPDELVISSPGGLLPTLDASRLLHETAARNSLLTREMFRLRLAEQAGMGFDRVYRELARIGKPPPQVVDGPRFTVTLQGGGGDTRLARYVATGLEPALRSDVDILLLLAYLRDNKTVNAQKAAPLLQRSPGEVQRAFDRAHRGGVLNPTRSTQTRQFPSYVLAAKPLAALRSSLRYRTETIDSDDKKLIRHLKRNGRITNADVRDYLDCDTYIARNRLTRLRKKGWIDFAPGSVRRGPDVVYTKLDKLNEDVPD